MEKNQARLNIIELPLEDDIRPEAETQESEPELSHETEGQELRTELSRDENNTMPPSDVTSEELTHGRVDIESNYLENNLPSTSVENTLAIANIVKYRSHSTITPPNGSTSDSQSQENLSQDSNLEITSHRSKQLRQPAALLTKYEESELTYQIKNLKVIQSEISSNINVIEEKPTTSTTVVNTTRKQYRSTSFDVTPEDNSPVESQSQENLSIESDAELSQHKTKTTKSKLSSTLEKVLSRKIKSLQVTQLESTGLNDNNLSQESSTSSPAMTINDTQNENKLCELSVEDNVNSTIHIERNGPQETSAFDASHNLPQNVPLENNARNDSTNESKTEEFTNEMPTSTSSNVLGSGPIFLSLYHVPIGTSVSIANSEIENWIEQLSQVRLESYNLVPCVTLQKRENENNNTKPKSGTVLSKGKFKFPPPPKLSSANEPLENISDNNISVSSNTPTFTQTGIYSRNYSAVNPRMASPVRYPSQESASLMSPPVCKKRCITSEYRSIQFTPVSVGLPDLPSNLKPIQHSKEEEAKFSEVNTENLQLLAEVAGAYSNLTTNELSQSSQHVIHESISNRNDTIHSQVSRDVPQASILNRHAMDASKGAIPKSSVFSSTNPAIKTQTEQNSIPESKTRRRKLKINTKVKIPRKILPKLNMLPAMNQMPQQSLRFPNILSNIRNPHPTVNYQERNPKRTRTPYLRIDETTAILQQREASVDPRASYGFLMKQSSKQQSASLQNHANKTSDPTKKKSSGTSTPSSTNSLAKIALEDTIAKLFVHLASTTKSPVKKGQRISSEDTHIPETTPTIQTSQSAVPKNKRAKKFANPYKWQGNRRKKNLKGLKRRPSNTLFANQISSEESFQSCRYRSIPNPRIQIPSTIYVPKRLPHMSPAEKIEKFLTDVQRYPKEEYEDDEESNSV